MDLDTEANRIKASVETLDTSVLAVGLNCAKLVKCFQAALEDQGGRNALQSLSHEDRQIVKDCIQDLNRHLLAIKSHETWKDRKKAESQARGLHVLMVCPRIAALTQVHVFPSALMIVANAERRCPRYSIGARESLLALVFVFLLREAHVHPLVSLSSEALQVQR